MKKKYLIIVVLILNQNLALAQTESEINLLLNGISEMENSIEITKSEHAKKIIAYGEKSLLVLSHFFTDSTLTYVKSECKNRILTKGELAIIMADRIERMPYFTITGIQHCTMTFCDNNPNIIEYYLGYNKKNAFKERYVEWLYSKERLKRVKGKARKERKTMIREWDRNTR
ncbi:hypothetical protein [Aquimarina algiphila]|uniref:hypothetical protein n=1 Tax=Aquimarina algiphila TaxID=2047982 RepID=UPI002330BC42|nr:hypothetical protein [Aquimarina algiphila]